MQDMYNWYCTSPKFSGSGLGGMLELHERSLPGIFEYMLFGVMKGE